MRAPYIIGFIALIFSHLIFANAADIRAIKHNIINMSRCWNQQNMKCAMDYYMNSNKTVYAEKTSVITGFPNIKKNYQTRFKYSMGKLQLEPLYIKQLATNVIASIAKIKFFYQHKHSIGLTSLVWQKNSQGKWKIILDHSSQIIFFYFNLLIK